MSSRRSICGLSATIFAYLGLGVIGPGSREVGWTPTAAIRAETREPPCCEPPGVRQLIGCIGCRAKHGRDDFDLRAAKLGHETPVAREQRKRALSDWRQPARARVEKEQLFLRPNRELAVTVEHTAHLLLERDSVTEWGAHAFLGCG